MYFSRAPIPFARDAFGRDTNTLPDNMQAFRHIGIYAYRAGFLQTFTQLPKGVLEQLESLEQLRALYLGAKIRVMPIDAFSIGIDTPDDVKTVRHILNKGK